MTTNDAAITRSASSGQVGLHWLKDHAWPLWLERGVDWRSRAFHEHIDLATLDCRATFRRLRVAARQTYVFAKAATYGVPRAAEAVALGLEFLSGPARLADGGFAWRFDLDNRPIDVTRDLYDHAFVLLAFAAAAEVIGADRLRPQAVTLGRYIADNFRHSQGGYENSIPPALPRQQNPHMHLFEALLAAREAFGQASGDAAFFDAAAEIAELFACRLFQPREGALPELFDESLAPHLEAGRFRVEPGHHYEWVWLLDWYANHASADGARWLPEFALASDALLEFAERHAVGPACSLVVNGVWSDGTVEDSGYRLWPQTERLKALARRGDAGRFAAALRAFERHFAGVHPGLWIERFDAAGRATQEPAPASSLYHLTAAWTDAAVGLTATPRTAVGP
jgi:mannose/cellobiose epimerase-like protein (N-acyl-D-glucosamine 2-epimerase family)